MSINDSTLSAAESGGKQGDFFAVDRRAMDRCYRLGLNPTVAYLVLARFTGGDNRTVKAGVHAVETYTGISRQRAKAAIEELERQGLISTAGDKGHRKIAPPHEIKGCEGYPPELDKDDTRLLSSMVAHADANGCVYLPGKWTDQYARDWDVRFWFNPRTAAARLVERGQLQDRGNGWFSCTPFDRDKAAVPDWIWLPNAIVTGAAKEIPPLELVRQSQDVLLLQLFVDLYRAQSLAENSGVHWRRLRSEFDREKIGQRGAFTVWGFASGTSRAWLGPLVRPHLTGKGEAAPDGRQQDTGWPRFWDRFHRLQSLGLVEMVGHLVEADNESAEIIHPFAMGNGEPIERELANAAHRAGLALLTDAQGEMARRHGGLWLAPIESHIADVQLFGICRLRYRPRTKMTGAWYAHLAESCAVFIGRYEDVARGEALPKIA